MLTCVPMVSWASGWDRHSDGIAKNVIFMVPDSMGISNVTAARIFANGIAGDPLHLERLERVGYQRTYSKTRQ